MGKLAAIFILLTGVLFPVAALAQEQQEFEVQAVVYHDYDFSGSWDTPDELQLSGWTLELYDDEFSILDSQTSSATDATTLGSNNQPSYVCISPQTDWLQTEPNVGQNYPGDAAWFCNDVNQETEGPHEFGVYQEEAEPEDIPDILGESNSIPDVKEPDDDSAVLGATTGEVLAETGTPAFIVPIIGFGLIISVAALAESTKFN